MCSASSIPLKASAIETTMCPEAATTAPRMAWLSFQRRVFAIRTTGNQCPGANEWTKPTKPALNKNKKFKGLNSPGIPTLESLSVVQLQGFFHLEAVHRVCPNRQERKHHRDTVRVPHFQALTAYPFRG